MGWTYTHKEKGTTIKSFFEAQMNYEDQNGSGKLLDCKVVNKVAYMAYQRSFQGKTEVYGFVYLLDYKNDYNFNFGYKDMDETMKPYYYDAPESIIRLLTPTDNQNAKEWRCACMSNVEKKRYINSLKAGQKIAFENPMTFSKAYCGKNSTNVFEVVDVKKGHYFAYQLGYTVKLTKGNLCNSNNPWHTI